MRGTGFVSGFVSGFDGVSVGAMRGVCCSIEVLLSSRYILSWIGANGKNCVGFISSERHNLVVPE